MPVHAVFLVAVVGGEVEAAAEPPDRFLAFFLGAEETHVGVGGGYVRVLRVDHQRHAHGLEAATGQFRTVGAGRGRQAVAEDVGEIDSALLDQCAVLDHPGAAAAAGRPVPAVLEETGAAVLGFEGNADTVLQVEQVGLHGLGTVTHGSHPDELERAQA